MTSLKVLYARKPELALPSRGVGEAMEKKICLDAELKTLIQVYVSRLNDCPFCEDLALARAVRHRLGPERFAALENFRESALFTPRQRSALAFVHEATCDRRVSDATWGQLRQYFSETEIVELVWLNAAENFFNLQCGVLGIESDRLAELARPAAGQAG